MDESQSIGAPAAVSGTAVVVANTPSNASAIGAVKRKRGRPPRGQSAKPPPPPPRGHEEEEEDVCFICFDGGSLVLCDRKFCPKAYHPACIKRDEAFFSSDAKWFCGWHICSVCQNSSSYYMCYTCTYSLCKECAKSADYFSVRRSKGFCSMCMKTIMLIEKKDQGHNGTVQVDFDDQSSWEYLFKVYWVCLKEKLSLTLSELVHAKNPCKESDKLHSYAYLGKEEGSIMARSKTIGKTGSLGTNMSEKLRNRATVAQAMEGSGTETSNASISIVKSAAPSNIAEADEVWHYRDPNGKVQGSFSMIQLRKWNMLDLFPSDMRIWTNDERNDSVLLSDALKGPVHFKTSSPAPELGTATSGDINGASKSSNSKAGNAELGTATSGDINGASKSSNSKAGNALTDGLSPPFPKFLDLMNGNVSYADNAQLCSQGEVNIALPNKERVHETVEPRSNNLSYVGPSSGQNMGSSTSSSKNSIDADTGFASGTNSAEKKDNDNLPERPSSTPKTSYDDVEAQAAEKLLSLSSGVPLRASDIQDWSSSIPKSNVEAKTGRAAAENKESAPSNSGPTWSSASSLADESDGYSPTAKLSPEEWDSGPVSVSSLKPAEEIINHVAPTPTSIVAQLNNHTSTSHEVPPNLSTWQAAVNEPIEFSTLAEESVSDLLAEVDAMECQTQSGVGSPTSAMRFSEQMIPGYKNFILALFEDLSPTHDPAKSDDIQLPCQSPMTDELVGASSRADAFDPIKRSDGNSSNKQ